MNASIFADPVGEVRKLYDFLGMDLTPQVESAMMDYINNDTRKKLYGHHVYKKGPPFTKEFIEREFKEYIDLMSKRVPLEEIV